MTHANERWRIIIVTDFERPQMAALRAELDKKYDTEAGFAPQQPEEKPQENII